MRDGTPTISYVVTSYRKPERLRLCLEALARQVYQNYEVIVTDDGTDSPENAEIAEEYGATWVTREHTYVDGAGVKNIPAVLNQGVAAAQGDIIQTLQQDHVVAPDFGLWLVRGMDFSAMTFGWADHRWGLFTVEDLDAMLRNLHLPDGEIRYERHFANGRRCYAELYDWRQCDGLDAAFPRQAWQPLDTNFIGQDHSWMEWVLRMQLSGLRLIVNPLMRLWHMEEPEASHPEAWKAQLAASDAYMKQKYGPDVWNGLIMPPIGNVRPALAELQEQFGVKP